ncbi:uncharacterized protein ASPGLDRAFT_1469956 [Aspergillus glaucus CBS 516.65]|uniref:Uncharacterized protein n=1 Tax=Aspergillus glaucus CBS 516.65 TaxID=1160497 RepID=A0A1L9VLE7_ASPGL|nr:hypothetical protein ASPGLDRAFT_1469956 [Aspergillus glaucus CBS 516.65]OJJ84749.1 hypothetical protein ASPGLDRAFT_1469956 [Aspergillus glaucus CBS 516.65]
MKAQFSKETLDVSRVVSRICVLTIVMVVAPYSSSKRTPITKRGNSGILNQFHNQKRHVPYLMEKHEPSEELVQPQDGAENSDKEKRVVMLPPGSSGYERQSKSIEEATKEGLAIAKRVVMLPPGSPGYERQSKFIEEATKEGLAIAKREPSPEPEDFNKREDASESITKPSWTGNVPLGNNPLPQNLPSEQKQGNEKRELKGKLDDHRIQCSGILGVCDDDGLSWSILEDINKNH